jgi:hypothetical protein
MTYGTSDSMNQLGLSNRNSANPNPISNQQNLTGMAQGFESKHIQDYVYSNTLNNSVKQRKEMLQKLMASGSLPQLQLKVLSSAHLEKDFTLLINPLGIVPQKSPDGYN